MNEIAQLMDRKSATEVIYSLNEDDLRFLNRLIVDRITFLQNVRQTKQLLQFYPGERVSFITKYGEEKTGTVIRLNQKTVSIDTGDGHGWWKVSPSLLKHVNK